jgi:hypothetical protein
MERRPALVVTVLALCIGLAVGAAPPRDAAAQGPPPLPPGVADLARQLGTAPGVDDPDADITIAPSPPDPAHPALALRRLLADMDNLAAAGDRRAAQPLARARAAAGDAWQAFAAGSPDLGHLTRATAALLRLEIALRVAMVLGTRDTRARAAEIQRDAAGIAASMAGAILRRAEASGVPAARLRDWYHGGREAHACAVIFPIHVEVGLVINSARGPAMAYQCALLQTAFDDAWVPN